MHSQWCAVVNPVSGYGKASRQWEAIKMELDRQDILFDCKETTMDKLGDAVVRDAVEEGYRRFICIGGDGHLHDMVNGMMTQRVVPATALAVAVISMGTGNDWIKTSGVPGDVAGAVSVIKAGKTIVQNVGVAKCYKDKRPLMRYFHNFAGVGFDAYVVAHTRELKRYGHIAYLLGMVKCLFGYKKPILRVEIDGAVAEYSSYLTIAGIGRYGGGGMMLTPGAMPEGGALYVSMAKDLTKWEVIRNIGKLYDGTYINMAKVETRRANKIKIEVITSDDEVYMEADGDLMGTGPFEIELLPGALRVVVP